MRGLSEHYTPSLQSLRGAALDGSTVAVSREIVPDLDTPVSAYLKLRGAEPSFLLESADGDERIGRYSFVGCAPRRILRADRQTNGSDQAAAEAPLDQLRRAVEEYRPALPPVWAPFEGGVLGYLSYEAARHFERLPLARGDPLDLPDAAFMDVDTLLIFDHVGRRARVVSHAWLAEGLERAYARAVDRIEAVISRLSAPYVQPDYLCPPQSEEKPRAASNVTRPCYEDMVRAAKEYIHAGEILQVVLSQRLSLPLKGDSFALYRTLRTVSPSPYMYYLDFVDHQLVGASPELLVGVREGVVFTRPIAGTRPRGATPAQDDALSADLLADEKERAEHLMLVDLARNDVGRVSAPGTVAVSDFMHVERFSHVMHLVSDVTGRLATGCTSFDALRAAFPAGTVSGAPKIRAMQIIAELEPDRRGPYAGAVGFVNTRGDMEMAITIRTGVARAGRLEVQVGAGIVADSVPEREFDETMNKARGMLEAAIGRKP